MQAQQLERLKKDSKELQNYVRRMSGKGRDELAYKLDRKRQYLDHLISELQEQ